MSEFTLILEHADALGKLNGKEVRASILNATAAVLACRGATKILVPAVGEFERERIEEGLESLPKERRDSIQMVDKRGAFYQRIKDYISPLTEQATEWPEDAFVSQAGDFLYLLSIASKYRAGIADDVLASLRGFIPIIDASIFKGEARYRLAEIFSLACAYEPLNPKHGTLTLELAESGVSTRLWSILQMAEFRSVVAESGMLGYIKHPVVGVKKLVNALEELISKPQVKPLMHLAYTGAELSGYKPHVETIEKILGDVEKERETAKDFSPPFIDLGPATLPIFRVALREKYPRAVPYENTIMLFEHARNNQKWHSWLNIGEERKLESGAKSALKRQLSELEKCRKVQEQLFK